MFFHLNGKIAHDLLDNHFMHRIASQAPTDLYDWIVINLILVNFVKFSFKNVRKDGNSKLFEY